ncbi:MAG: nucleoside hydrolase, partial [Longimicrobiales bacterium]
MDRHEFPTLSEERMRQLLAPPTGKMRVVIDTDAANEIDDQWTIAWALLSQDRLDIEGMYAAPFSFQHHQGPLLEAYADLDRDSAADPDRIMYAGSYRRWAQALKEAGTDPATIPFVGPDEGMELSYQEILKVYELLEIDPAGQVYRGSPGYLDAVDQPFENDAVAHLIERAMAPDDRPLYVVAIGAVANIASALLIEPRIVENMVVIWTSAYPSAAPHSNLPSLNLMQDYEASSLIFDSGVPHVYLPGFYIGEELKISLPDMERWVEGKGKIGDYLHYLYLNNPIYRQRGVTEHFGRTWIVWDLINIAWLLN